MGCGAPNASVGRPYVLWHCDGAITVWLGGAASCAIAVAALLRGAGGGITTAAAVCVRVCAREIERARERDIAR